jgi:serine/threonine protein phosphatase PrpC
VLRAYCLTDRGRVRPINEDFCAIDDGLGLCIVADGMGGHNAGEVAARLAVDAAVDFIRRSAGVARSGEDTWPYGFDGSLSEEGNVVRTAIHLSNARVLEASMSDAEYNGMGTTIVVALVAGGTLTVGHAGDSRLYVVGQSGVRQITQDDSWIVSMMAQDPTLDPAALKVHPMRNALTNVVGGASAANVHVAEVTLETGDLFVMTTDGVHGAFTPAGLAAMLMKQRKTPADLPALLVKEAIARGSTDNCTAVVACYTPA